MNGKSAIFLVLAIAAFLVIIVGVTGSLYMQANPPLVSYQGKVSFEQESDYTTFKRFLAGPEVQVLDVQALSSAPPIVVKYDVAVPRSTAFGYPSEVREAYLENDGLYNLFWCMWICGIMLCGTFSAYAYASWR